MIRTNPRYQAIPVFFLTSSDDVQSRIACFHAGGDDHITKPPVKEELAARLRARIERSRLLTSRMDIDPSTGLLQRRAFVRALEARLSEASRKKGVVSLVILDLDRFKSGNDTHGHMMGDQVLRELGKALTLSFRQEDLRGRWGGEEFVLAFPGQEAKTVMTLMERLLASFAENVFEGEKSSFSITFSAGVASYPRDGDNYERLLRTADQRLYRAKDKGRSRIEGPSEPGADLRRL